MLKVVARTAGALGVAGAVFFGVGMSAAGAQSADECVFDGDLQSYLECVAGAGAENENGPDVVPATVETNGSLARTGSDVGSMVGIGSGLVILGGATVYGVRQRRQHTAA